MKQFTKGWQHKFIECLDAPNTPYIVLAFILAFGLVLPILITILPESLFFICLMVLGLCVYALPRIWDDLKRAKHRNAVFLVFFIVLAAIFYNLVTINFSKHRVLLMAYQKQLNFLPKALADLPEGSFHIEHEPAATIARQTLEDSVATTHLWSEDIGVYTNILEDCSYLIKTDKGYYFLLKNGKGLAFSDNQNLPKIETDQFGFGTYINLISEHSIGKWYEFSLEPIEK